MSDEARGALNILHVLRAPVGGLFRHVVDLARGQIARGHRVGMIADSGSGGAQADATLAELANELALGLSRVPMSRQIGISDLGCGAPMSRVAPPIRPPMSYMATAPKAAPMRGWRAMPAPSASTRRTAAACTIDGARPRAFSICSPSAR